MALQFLTAEGQYPPSSQPVAAWAAMAHWPRAGTAPLPEATLLSPWIRASVNYGRWLTACPFCCSVQVTSPVDPRFFCVECENAGTGVWLRVEWPPNPEGIESLLLVRPPELRNWEPDESLGDLQAENLEHADVIEAHQANEAIMPTSFGVTDEQRAAIEEARAHADEARIAQGFAPMPPAGEILAAGTTLDSA